MVLFIILAVFSIGMSWMVSHTYILHCVSGDKFSLVTCTLASCLGVAEPSCSKPVENSIRMMHSCSPYSYCVKNGD